MLFHRPQASCSDLLSNWCVYLEISGTCFLVQGKSVVQWENRHRARKSLQMNLLSELLGSMEPLLQTKLKMNPSELRQTRQNIDKFTKESTVGISFSSGSQRISIGPEVDWGKTERIWANSRQKMARKHSRTLLGVWFMACVQESEWIKPWKDMKYSGKVWGLETV